MTLKDRIFTAVLAVLPVLSFIPQYISPKIIAWLDMPFYFLPFHILPAETLRAGTLPLWNPYIYCGQPLMANMQSAVLYPPDMLFYVLPPALAVKALTFLAFFIMAFSMYMFMRLYKVSEEGSLLGAFLFSFTYYMTVKAVELADLHAMVWLPAVLYFVKKFAMRGRLIDLFFTAFTLSLSFLGGHAQVFANVYLLFAAYYFYETVSSGRKGCVKAFAAINGLFVLAVLMQALPAAEFIMHSRRMAPGGMGYEASAGGYMRLEHLLEMFFPFITAFMPKTTSFSNWMGLIDIGVPAIFLSVLGASKISDGKYRIFLISVFTASFCCSFMGGVPFYKFMWENIPFLQMIRYPAKINLVFFFAACVMAGHGFDLLFKLEAGKMKGFIRLILGTAAVMLLIYAALGLEVSRNAMLKFYKDTFEPDVSLDRFVDQALMLDVFRSSFNWFLPVVFAALAVLYLAAAKGIKNTAVKYTVLLLAMASAAAYNRGSNELYTKVDNMISGSGTIDFLQKDADFKYKRVLAPGVTNQLEYDVNTKTPEERYYYIRDCLFPNVPMYHGIENADGFDSLILKDFFLLKSALNALDKPWDHPAFSLLNVKYIASLPDLQGNSLKKKFRGMTNIYEYARPSGPAYFIPASEGWPAAGQTEKIGEIELPATSLKFMKKQGDLGIIFKRKNINVFEAGINAGEPGTLVISENFYPGWNAYEAGKKLKVFKANVCFMAVSVDRGNHNIVFKYEPFTFALGALLSLMALGFLAAAGVFKLKAVLGVKRGA